MIKDEALDGDYAIFNDQRTMRYALSRSLPFGNNFDLVTVSICFIMLNPSTADAFKPDPTITTIRNRILRCRALGRPQWQVNRLDVVNLFAFRTPFPETLKQTPIAQRGADDVNTDHILQYAKLAHTVVFAWGANGGLDDRAAVTAEILREHRIQGYHLGLSKDGFPKHPLARGKHRIPDDQELIPW